MANTKVTQHVIANNAITADQLAAGAVTDAKLHSTLDLSGKTLTLPATAIPSASTATTQAASDNSTKIATTAYVETAISNLVDSAPAALDTLNEIAAALGDDANYASTTTAAIAAKLPLAGGTLTGDLVLSGAPTSGLHPATKTYTDTADALKLNLTGGTLTGDLILNTTTALKIPAGTTGQRPSASTGQIRWNTTDGALEVYNGTAWTAVGTGSSNKVLDTFTGDGSTTTFTLSITPANEDAIMVFIDGAYQEKGDYVLTNNSLALGTAPLSGEKIAVHTTTASVHDGTTALNQAFTGDGSTTDFTLSQDPKSENNTQIYINGVYQQKTDYTVTGTTLAFDTAPDTGDIIEVNMFTVATLGNTDTVNEGVSNLYHTDARARGAISVSGNALSYNSSTGVITSAYEESPTFTGTVTTPTLITGAYGGSGSAGDGFRLNSTDLYGQIDASDKVRLTVNGDSFLNGGNVGIGTTLPASNLHVKTSVDNSVAQGLVIERSANTDKGYINYQGGAFRMVATDGDPIRFGHVSSSNEVSIHTDGSLLVGTTSAYGTTGTTINSAGLVYSSADGDRSGQFDRTGVSDGEIVRFTKAGGTVGSIGVAAGPVAYMVFNDTTTDNVAALKGASGAILPSTNAGADKDGTMNLGSSGARFESLYLSGEANIGSVLQTTSSTGLAGNFENTNTSGYGLRVTTYATGAQYGLAVDSYGGGYSRDFTVGADGNVNVLTGNLVIGTAGKGIDFSANANAAGMSSEVLDDYEEGTFTPVFTGVTGTPTYNYQQGYYTKVGRQVFGGGIIGMTNSNLQGSGTIQFSIPFTLGAGNLGYTAAFFSDASGFAFGTMTAANGETQYSLYGQGTGGSSSISMTVAGSTAAGLRYSDVNSVIYFRFGLSYYTDS